jgi:hypothetical protein
MHYFIHGDSLTVLRTLPDESVQCSGTTLAVAASLGLDGIGIELNADYIELAKKRIVESVSLFA